jgi:hypothetical protein
MNKETTTEIINTIYAYGDRMAIFQDLQPELKGGYISLICPRCGKRRAYTYQPGAGRTPHIIRCNRSDSCGYQATLVQYAAGSENPRGEDFINAIRFLAQKTGIAIEGDNVNLEQIKKPEYKQQETKEINPIDEYFVKKYEDMSMNQIALDYLTKRGISESTAIEFGVKFAGWGKWPHYEVREDGKKKPLRQWYPGRLVVPIFDTQKQLISLYGRAIPVDREPFKHLKHDFLGETKGIFNQKALDEESVHITEGVFDALSIIEATRKTDRPKHAAAIHGVYGLRWDLVKAKNVCFCFDNDKAGAEWKKLAEKGLKLGKRIFFLSPETYQGFGDLSELWENTKQINFQYQELKEAAMK